MKDLRYWYFNFRHDGHRFQGSTKTTDRHSAELIESAARNRVKRLGVAGAIASPWRTPSPIDTVVCATTTSTRGRF